MLFHHMAYDYSCADWHGLCDHFRGVPWDRLGLMYISLIISIGSNLTHLHGFQQLVLLPYF